MSNARQQFQQQRFLLILLVLLVSCSPAGTPLQHRGTPAPANVVGLTPATPSSSAVSPAVDELTMSAATQSVTSLPPAVAAQPTVQDVTETEVAPIHPSPGVPNVAMVCRDMPLVYDLQDTFGIAEIAALEFVDENSLFVKGWIPRQLTAAADDLYAPRYAFSQVLLELDSDRVLESSPRFESLGRSPCITAQCKTQIIDQSPDMRWQLVTAGGLPQEVGLWLVGTDTTIRLIEVSPTSLRWTWSADSSLLWLTYSVPEYSDVPAGNFVLAVELGESANVVGDEVLSNNHSLPLYPPQYISAFSPSDKMILSTGTEWLEVNTERYYTFDASTIPPVQIATGEPIPALKSVVWNEPTNDFLLIIAAKSGIEIRQNDGDTVLWVPLSAVASIFPDISEDLLSGALSLDNYMPNTGYAVSTELQRLAVGYGDGQGIVVFECAAPD